MLNHLIGAQRRASCQNRLSLLGALLAACLVFVPTGSFAESSNAVVQQQATIASVTVASVVESEMIGRVPVSGTLFPRQEVLVYPQVNGSSIDSLQVDVGDTVKSGDVLATLNASTLSAELTQAEAEFASAQASVSQSKSQITSAISTATRTTSALDRAQRLRDAGTTTQVNLDQALADSQSADAAVASANDGLAMARAQLQQAQARLNIASLNLKRTGLRAPVTGLISARNGQIGAIATSGGEPIYRIITDGVVEVEAEVIETAMGRIAIGDKAELSIAGVGNVSGTVRRISPTVDPVNRLGTILVEMGDPTGLRSGVFASGWIITEERMSSAVPTSAVLTDTSGTFVLVVNDGILQKRPVVAGLIWNNLREILTGVTLGETVVAKAGSFFDDGDRINPIVPDLAVADVVSK